MTDLNRQLARKGYIFDGLVIPGHMVDSLEHWVRSARPMGQFLTAVVSNDLSGACAHADPVNQGLLPAYVGWLYSEAPGPCWGSPAKVACWIRDGGMPEWIPNR